jgi:hypothetical protein
MATANIVPRGLMTKRKIFLLPVVCSKTGARRKTTLAMKPNLEPTGNTEKWNKSIERKDWLAQLKRIYYCGHNLGFGE